MLYILIVCTLCANTPPTLPACFSHRDATAFPVLLICTLVAERKLMIPSWRMTLVRCTVILPSYVAWGRRSQRDSLIYYYITHCQS